MPMNYYYGFDYTWYLLVLPAFLLALWAQLRVKTTYAKLQQQILKDFQKTKAKVAAADSLEAKQKAATTASNAMSDKVHNATVAMFKTLQTKYGVRAWFQSLLHSAG